MMLEGRRTLCSDISTLLGTPSPHSVLPVWQGRRVLLNLYEVLTNDERFKGSDSGLASFCPEHWLADDAHRAGAWCAAAHSPKTS